MIGFVYYVYINFFIFNFLNHPPLIRQRPGRNRRIAP